MQAVMPILGWRWLLGLSSLPCFILLIFFGLIPESPRYLCSRGRASDAMLVLERIARMNNGSLPPGILTSDPKRRVDYALGDSVTTHLLMPEDSLKIDGNTSSKSDGINEFRALWSHELIRSTLLLWLVNFACYFSYYGIVQLISEVSNGKRSCASVEPHLMQPKDSSLYINVLVTSFAEFPGLLVAALLIDRVGRRVSMGGLILFCCASVSLFYSVPELVLGSFAVLHAYSPEIYPTSCRNTGVGVANSIGRIGSAIATLMIVTLPENCLEKEAVFVIVLPLFLAGVGCAFFPLETKGRDMY
ncbi:hypothetical protein EJB05_54870, partial [Eragrostis curvula]